MSASHRPITQWSSAVSLPLSVATPLVGVDIDPGKVAKLSAGEVPCYQAGLRNMLSNNITAGRLRFTTDNDMATDYADVHFLVVGTPQKKGEYDANLRHVHSVIDERMPRLSRSSVIVGKSTAPVGTAVELDHRARALALHQVDVQVDVEVAWNPEFLRDCGVGQGLGQCVSATKISFINVISEVCEAAYADVTVLADALGYDPRIGRRFLNAGLGFGGGCLPEDIRAFMARAGELGASQALTFLREVDSINMRRRTRMVELTSIACGGR